MCFWRMKDREGDGENRGLGLPERLFLGFQLVLSLLFLHPFFLFSPTLKITAIGEANLSLFNFSSVYTKHCFLFQWLNEENIDTENATLLSLKFGLRSFWYGNEAMQYFKTIKVDILFLGSFWT